MSPLRRHVGPPAVPHPAYPPTYLYRLLSLTFFTPAFPIPSPLPLLQCEQTVNGTGCTEVGVCGKTPEVGRGSEMPACMMGPLTSACS